MSRRARPSLEPLEGKALLSLPGLVTTLTTDRSVYGVGQEVRMTFTVTNEGSQPVTFAPDYESQDFTVSSGGKVRWDQQYGQVIVPLAVLRTLAPGQSYTLTATWKGSPNEGGPSAATGTLQVRCELDPGLTTAITVTPGTPSPSYATSVPIAPLQGGPFGGNPTYAADAEIDDLYQMLLGRNADEVGQTNGVAALKAGMPLSTVASVLLHTAEYDSNVVASDYVNYLGRNASPDEIKAWVSRMQAGTTEEQVADAFLSSPEFSALHPDAADFIQDLYEDALGRPATATEISTLEASGASRATIVGDVLNSTAAETKAVQGLYADILDRPADPNGLALALPALQSGKVSLDDLAAYLLGSPEFKARADQASV